MPAHSAGPTDDEETIGVLDEAALLLDASNQGAQRDAGTSLSRMLQILDLITLDRPAITLEEISAETGYTTSTSYRYVRELTSSGLLAPIGSGSYAIGARVIELDLLARRTDPVLDAAAPMVAPLLDSIREGMVMICELRGSQAVSVLTEAKPKTSAFHHQRGTTMDLYRGSPAKAILAHLPNRRLNRMFDNQQEEIAAAGMGADWRSFIKKVGELRKLSYIQSVGELYVDHFALSSPIFYYNGDIAGSLTLILPIEHYTQSLIDATAPILVEAARSINRRLEQLAASRPAIQSASSEAPPAAAS